LPALRGVPGDCLQLCIDQRQGTSKLSTSIGFVVSRHPVALAWSGGKDSSLALAALRSDPSLEVVVLITTVTREFDRISMHGVRRSVLADQVASIGLPLIESPIPAAASNELYQQAFAEALEQVRGRWPELRHLAFGDLFLTDVRAYRERLLAPLGWEPLFPLWLRDTTALAREFIASGFRAILTCVDTTQLGAEFAGREFDSRLLEELPATCDPCGERGEFHTCVYAGPIFRWPLELRCGERLLRDDRFEYCDVELTTGRDHPSAAATHPPKLQLDRLRRLS
jgi:uncharacterized protein (TIGR00290 family)